MEKLLWQGWDLEKILSQVSQDGATAIRLLSDEFRQALFREAEGFNFKARPEVFREGTANEVKQQIASFKDFPVDSLYRVLPGEFQAGLDLQLDQLSTYPFSSRLKFNSEVLQRYQDRSLGITPHQDGASFINLVAVFMIAGEGDFYTCPERSTKNALLIPAVPGDVLLMKAPGLFGQPDQQFHFIQNIRGTRYTYGLRQKINLN